MLGSNRLFKPQLDIDICHSHVVTLLQQINDPLSEFVVDRPKHQHRFSELCIIQLNFLLPISQGHNFTFLFSHIDWIDDGMNFCLSKTKSVPKKGIMRMCKAKLFDLEIKI